MLRSEIHCVPATFANYLCQNMMYTWLCTSQIMSTAAKDDEGKSIFIETITFSIRHIAIALGSIHGQFWSTQSCRIVEMKWIWNWCVPDNSPLTILKDSKQILKNIIFIRMTVSGSNFVPLQSTLLGGGWQDPAAGDTHHLPPRPMPIVAG